VAKTLLGPPLSGLRGTIGGVIFSANGAGTYACQWHRGANRRSPLQTDRRRATIIYAKAWAALSDADKINWDIFAADPAQEQTDPLGNPYYLSGSQWFVKINTRLYTVGRGQRSTYPTSAYPAPPPIVALRVSCGAETSIIGYATNTFGPTYDCVIFMWIANTIGPGVAPTRRKLLIAAQVPGGNLLDFSAQVAALFGSLNAGQRAFAVIHRQTVDGMRCSGTSMNVQVIA
jgi:hypothetical protein